MAEVEQIFNPDEAKKVIEVGKAIGLADDYLIKFLANMDKLDVLMKENASSISVLTKAQKEATKTSKDLDSVGKKLAASEKNLKELEDKRYPTIVKNRVELQKQTAEMKRNIIVAQTQKGAYEKINASLNSNIQAWKKLSAEQRNNRNVGGKLLKTIQQQDKELKKLDTQIGRSQRNVGNYGSALSGVGRNLMGAFGVVGGVMAFATVLKSSVKSISDFTSAQSKLQAIAGKTASELKGLTEQAKLLGGITEFTATQVTDLQIELAKLGFTTTEIELSTKAILNFASATGAALPDAAKTAGVALRVFDLDASRMEEVVSTLAVATTKSALSFEHYETILSTAGPVAKAYGFELADLVALTGKLTDAGFDASSAATATRNILLNLADSGGALAKELGGSVNSFDELIPALVQLRERGVSLNETLELTDKRSVAAFNQFLTGAESATVLRDSIVGVNEELQVMVDKRLDNLAGDVTKLSSAWEGFVLKAEKGGGVLRGAVQFATDAIIKLSNVGLLLKDSSKFTEEEVSRMWDMLNSLTDKKAKQFRAIVSSYSDTEFADLFGEESEFKEKLRDIGFTISEADLLYKEYLNRRNTEKQLEIKAEYDKNNKIVEDTEKTLKLNEQKQKESYEKQLKQREEWAANMAAANEIANSGDGLAEREKEKPLDVGSDIDSWAKYLDSKSQLEIDSAIEAGKTATDIRKEQLQEQIDAEKQAAEKRKEIQQEVFNAAAEIATSIFDIRINNLQKEFDVLEMQKEAELSNKNLTESQKQQIEEKYAKKSAEIKRKQAQAEKRKAIFSTIINTASAVVEALPNLVLAGIAAALGAVQLGVIASQPIPQFAKGTKNAPGEFIAGEKGRELLQLKTGEQMMVNEATYFKGNKFKGATIKSNKETEQIISQSNEKNQYYFDTVDLKNEMRAVRKAILSKPVLITDTDGRVIGKQSGNYRETYLNRLKR